MIESTQREYTEKEEKQIEMFREDNLKAKRAAAFKLLKDSYYNDFKERIDAGSKPNDVYEEFLFKKVNTLVTNTRNVAVQGFWFLTFTINRGFFPDESYLPRLQKKIDKALTKKCVARAIWTFELTKDKIPHAHMLLELDPANPIAKHTFEKGFQNTFKDVGFVHFKHVPEAHIQDKLDYIRGIKWDTEKDVMIEEDRIWREQVGLDPVYSTGDWKELWGGRGLLT